MIFLKKLFSFATLTLLVALCLSAIAAWYSVLGLTAIFSAAVIPIMIMGGSLEFAKVVTTVWLHKYWNRAGWKLKLYLVPAVIMLAFLTSMGIFGFLSKAHSDQSLVSGDVQAKIAVYDQKIQTAKDVIDANRKALQQMDAAVDQTMGRTQDEKGAALAVRIRGSQSVERLRLNNEIASEQETIAKLNELSAPIRAQVRKVEAEVGPIKYIAALIYGDNPDNNLLERAVRWVIIVIVFVFDPLALTLVLAAQSSYEWLEEDLRKENEEKNDKDDFKEKFFASRGKVDPSLDLEFGGPVDLHIAGDIAGMKAKKEEETKVSEDEDFIHPDVTTVENLIETPTDEITLVTDEIAPFEQPPVSNLPIQTEGVTVHELDTGYVDFNGKHVSKAALHGMHPHLFSNEGDTSNFGNTFPKFAAKGDVFVRTDVQPHRVYKFEGRNWIEVNKELTNSYLYDDEYIKHLINKIDSGEYDVDLLSENEKLQIEEYLYKVNNPDN